MKVIKEHVGKYKDKEYSRGKINISEKILKEAKMEYGDDLKIEIKDGKIIIEKQ